MLKSTRVLQIAIITLALSLIFASLPAAVLALTPPLNPPYPACYAGVKDDRSSYVFNTQSCTPEQLRADMDYYLTSKGYCLWRQTASSFEIIYTGYSIDDCFDRFDPK